MRILMLYPFDIYKADSPGADRAIAFATKLTHQQHDVRLVYYYHPSSPEREGVAHKDRFVFTAIPYVQYQRTLLSKIRNIAALADNADLIHFQSILPEVSLPALFAGFWKKKPVHCDFSDLAGIPGLSDGLRSSLRHNLLKLVDTLSIASQDELPFLRLQGFKEHRTFLIPNGSFDPQSADEFPLNRAYRLLLGDLA